MHCTSETLFNSFKKIIVNKKKNDLNNINDKITLFQKCKDIMNIYAINNLVIFINNLIGAEINILNELANIPNYKIHIVSFTNNYYGIDNKINIYGVVAKTSINMDILETIFGFNANQNIYELIDGSTFICNGKSELNTDCDKSFIVKKNSGEYKQKNITHILNGINQLIDYSAKPDYDKNIFISMYPALKSIMVDIINTKNIKAEFIYQKLKNKYYELIGNNINNKDDLSKTETNKLIDTYAQKINVKIKKDKYEQILKERVYKNQLKLNKGNKINIDTSNVDVNNIYFAESCDFFKSILTYTNWYDEIKTEGGLGLLIKVNTEDITKLGFRFKINILNVTTTLFPVSDYISKITKYFSETPANFGNLNDKNIISGTAIGEGNAVIPIYINEYHWKSVKHYYRSCLGIILAHNPMGYCKNHDNFIFALLSIYDQSKFRSKF